MSKEQVEFKMLFLFPGSEGKRIQVNVGEDGVFIVTIDVHGMGVFDARRAINNIIAMMRVAFRLCIIHGYQHGTKIKEMLYQSFANGRVTNIHCDGSNPGLSICSVSALC